MSDSSAEFLTAAARPEDFPPPGAPEVAFLGRSNVGKSSLINRLVNRKALARTSTTPGKTRLLHWYRVTRDGVEVWLVDLPGYGFAKVSKQERAGWQALVESYLAQRKTVEDILGGVHKAIATRTMSLVRRVGVEEEITFTGGVSRNTGMVRALGAVLGKPINVSDDGHYMGALGAALFALEREQAAARGEVTAAAARS